MNPPGLADESFVLPGVDGGGLGHWARFHQPLDEESGGKDLLAGSLQRRQPVSHRPALAPGLLNGPDVKSSCPRGAASRRWNAGGTALARHLAEAPGAARSGRSPGHRRIRSPARTRPSRRIHRAASRSDHQGRAPGTRPAYPRPADLHHPRAMVEPHHLRPAPDQFGSVKARAACRIKDPLARQNLPAAPGRPTGHSKRCKTRSGHGRRNPRRIRRIGARAQPRRPRCQFFPPQITATAGTATNHRLAL
jgi:hypothetical protein